MKMVKSSNWIRLRGQMSLSTNQVCKIDTPVVDQERVFIVPETEEEKKFFELDCNMGITKMVVGPTTHNPDDEWGWRFDSSLTEEHVKAFEQQTAEYMVNINKVVAMIEQAANDKSQDQGELLTTTNFGGKSNKLVN